MQTVVTHEPLATIESYCQTKVFTASTGINPLVASASALFSLVTRLGKITTDMDIPTLRSSLFHEIKAFECAAHTQGYSDEQILIARYAICATLDESIENTQWGQACWSSEGLLHTFQKETSGSESFFMLIDKLSTEPTVHIELLEFMYLCISLGFGGKFRHLVNGRDELDKVLDKLYYLIREVRKDLPALLSAPYQYFHKVTVKKTFPIPVAVIAGLLGILLLIFYMGFNYLLSITSAPLYNKLTSIITTINHEITNA